MMLDLHAGLLFRGLKLSKFLKQLYFQTLWFEIFETAVRPKIGNREKH